MKKNNSSSGVSFLGLLGLLFIALKLTDVIDWSWWLVLLPIYGGIVFLGVILVFVGIMAVRKTNNKNTRKG